jgi:UDP-N-acetylmuramyl tripeptide synthase
LSGRVVITTDNPRTEAPAQILADIAVAAPDAIVVEAREEAIRAAVMNAGSRDIVLIAGKGHEDYQEVNGVRRPFSDVGEARAALLERAGL